MEILPSEPCSVLRPVVAVSIAFVAVLALVRLLGHRALARVSSVDFVATLAIASAAASITVSDSVPLLTGVIALATVLAL